MLVVAVVAGCTGEPAPTTTLLTFEPYTPTAAPTPTPEPDPDEATVPPERPDLSQVDAETAQALAVYFLQLYPYVYATGDLTDWRALSHPECIFCASVIGNVEDMVAEGEHWEGGLPVFSDVAVTEVSASFYNVVLDLTEEPARRLGSDGAVIEESTGGGTLITLVLVADDGRWLVREGQVDDPPR
jgi:hypothetical protein